VKLKEIFPEWPDAQNFLRDMVVKYGSGMDFAAALQVLLQTSQQLGAWHKGRCQSAKDRLVSLGDRQLGRVQLASFYTDALARFDQHGSRRPEHIDYLRELGALDESVRQRPSLLIANYINSRSNCFSVSSFYTVCCANECESLLRHLEWEIAAPAATPARVAHLVRNLPSSTAGAPRELPDSLLKRLYEVAAHHGGYVPIHGRLFAQWMHHAYPRECPYPHIIGTTHPQTADEWMTDRGRDSAHTREEVEAHINSGNELEFGADAAVVENADELPWSDAEELLVQRPPCWISEAVSTTPEEVVPDRRPFNVARFGVFALAISAMFWAVKDKASGTIATLRSAILSGLKGSASDKARQHKCLA
jgi:hypothetical protein